MFGNFCVLVFVVDYCVVIVAIAAAVVVSMCSFSYCCCLHFLLLFFIILVFVFVVIQPVFVGWISSFASYLPTISFWMDWWTTICLGHCLLSSRQASRYVVDYYCSTRYYNLVLVHAATICYLCQYCLCYSIRLRLQILFMLRMF